MDSKTFRNFYYLKEELVCFCRENGLPVKGGKLELTDRIAHYLETGEIWSGKSIGGGRAKRGGGEICEDAPIEANFVCSESHRAFFKDRIGRGFTFNVAFQKWLKNNAGKTYAEAIEAYYRIIEGKKRQKTGIDRLFEYNRYVRDFFASNRDRTLEDAIRCWKYKKGLPGDNRYDEADLVALC